MTQLLFTAIAYVLGAIPTSYWVGRMRNVDLRHEGSGNLGATNTYRVLGLAAAIPVVIVDVLKGWIAVWWLPQIDGVELWAWGLLYGAAAIVGHVFSFWVGFRGGKGVATSAGVFVGIAPAAVLVALATWLLVTFTTRIVSLGSISAALVVPIAVALLPHQGGDLTVFFSVALALFVIWAHRSNIRRILRGEENRFGSRPKAAGNG